MNLSGPTLRHSPASLVLAVLVVVVVAVNRTPRGF
jgi:hypothetical protein